MAFTHTDKNPGDLIRSADWNDMGREVTRLNADKVDLAGGQTVAGTLGIKSDLTVGTANLGAQLRIFRKQEDGRDATGHGALVVGSDTATSASLRVGYAQAYSWLQGQGQQNLAINPRGGDVGVGTDTPRSRLSVAGALSVGAAYASGSQAPANSLIVEGSVGIGTAAPQQKLHVEGNARVNGSLDVTGALGFGSATRQMVNLWGTGFGVGVQPSTAYFRSDAHFAFYRGGAHADTQLTPGTGGTALMSILNSGSVGIGTVSPQARLHVAGGDLRIDAGQEILFADNGQIRSADNNHRILFRRGENKLELREHGDIVFSSGATAGNETAKAVLRADGSLGIGTATPRSAIDTFRGVMSGSANDYVKAQFTLSGGGVVTYTANRLKWTNRFIAISANRGTSFSSGYVDIYQPTTDIPAANVWDGVARSANADGVTITDWDALYAVHTPGGGPGDVSFRIVNYKAEFNAPSNWILVAVRNGDYGYVKLGTGDTAGRAITPAAGNTDAVGILWPRDAFGGAGDAAWMRWYSRGGEAATLEIGTSNDADDHIALMPSGNVGIGTNAPGSRLHVSGGDIQWGNGSVLSTDQGGSIELGGNNGKANAGGASPYIDFHYGSGRTEDNNARIINDGDGQLTIDTANTFRVNTVFTVSLGCADFRIGHATRRKSPGRALVDGTDTLHLNYGPDWPNVRASGSWSTSSSRELKDGIAELGLDEAIGIIGTLEPVRFHLKADESKAPHLGFIAEDVPEAVAAGDRKGVIYNHIIAALTRVVKEQQRRIDELSRRVNGEGANA